MKKLIIGLAATAAIAAPLTLAAAPSEASTGITQRGRATTTSSQFYSGFDRHYLIETAGWVRQSTHDVDRYLRDGIAVSSAMYNLSDAYGYMEHAGTPPRVRAADYRARLSTLASFTRQAARVYDYDPMTGTAKYVVVRHQTGILFHQINRAIGTHLTLPPR